MKIHIILILHIVAVSLSAQKSNSISVSYFDNFLAGNQLEIKTAVYPLPSQIGFTIGIALDPNNIEINYSLKGGLIYDLYRKNKLSVSLGARFYVERFFSVDINATHFAYNYDFPIDIKYDILPKFNISLSVIPTWNKFRYYNNSVGFSYSAGIGYYF